MRSIVWFREDLRLFDNPAFYQAASAGQVLPVFIRPKKLGGAKKWWLHHSLDSLTKQLADLNVALLLLDGEPDQILLNLAQQFNCQSVFFNRVYSPLALLEQQKLETALNKANIKPHSFNGQLLIEPNEVFNKQGSPFKVFTPFWRTVSSQLSGFSLYPIPKNIQAIQWHGLLESCFLDSWHLLPTKPDWSQGLQDTWGVISEQKAQQNWQTFLQTKLTRYAQERDFADMAATSLMSPYLSLGQISPRQMYNDVCQLLAEGQISHEGANKFLSELAWREFSRYLLVHFPSALQTPFNARFAHFPWAELNEETQSLLAAWKSGQTGYPIIDAGMRELWFSGYMHNRVRMLVASFLCKHCLIDWKIGMQWFWDTLVDADVANNTMSWQWVAGCGADAAPYFRIFNPELQSQKFAAQGAYLRRWVPELANLENKFLHTPYNASVSVLQRAGVELGKDYPVPIIEHQYARERALLAYKQLS